MFRKVLVLVFAFVLSASSSLFAQEVLNSYKYFIIPNQYEFQKSENQYQLNALTEFLFEKEGYNVFMTNEPYPEELAKNPCLGLKVLLKNNSGMLTTKLTMDFIDCYNSVVYSTPEGKSKIKDYQKSYQDATRKTFDTLKRFEYAYNGSTPKALNKPLANNTEISTTKAAVPVAATTKVDEKEATEVVSEKTELPPVEATPEVQEVNTQAPVKVTEATVAVPAVVPVVESTSAVKTETKSKTTYTIEGTYLIDIWGKCKVAKKGNGYSVIGGDENYEFATISKTSKPTMFMVKKTGFSQSQLLELTDDGNLQIDTETGVKVFKRVD